MRTVPAVKIALILGAGILLGDRFGGGTAPMLLLGISVAVFILAVIGLKQRGGSPLVLLAVFLLGILLIQSDRLKYETAEFSYDEPWLLGGTVGKEIYRDDDRQVSLFHSGWISGLASAPLPFRSGLRLIVNTDGRAHVHPGSKLLLYGEIREYPARRNPGGRDLRREFGRDGVIGWIEPIEITVLNSSGFRPVDRLRESITGGITDLFAPRQAGLLTGMLLGDKSALPADVRDDFRRSGLYHLLAVSGLHVGFLFALFTVIISPLSLSLWARRLVLFIVLWGYVLVTGANPPTLRAALMISLFLMSYALQRVPRPWNLWGSAALLIILFAPSHLFKAGFQLSFAAMAGVLLAMEIRKRIITWTPGLQAENLGLRRVLSTRIFVPILVSICAVVFMAPVLTWHFGGFAPVSIILNLVAIPLAGTIFGLAWITILIKILFGFSLTFLVSTLELCLRGLEKLAHLGSQLPGNAYTDYGGIVSALILLGILLGIFFSKSWKHRTLCAVVGLALLRLIPLTQSNRQLRIEFLDVGQGDATLLCFPGSQNLLIDCGNAEAARFELIPSFRRRGINRIHNLLISHFDVDHAGGALELLEALRVDRILVGTKFQEEEMGEAVLELAETKSIPIRTLCFGDTIAGIPGTLALVLWPPRNYQTDDNRCSIVLKIRCAESDILFTGDISNREEKFLLAGGDVLQSELLKVAHHGSKYSSSRAFLEQVNPEVAVVSCGRRNPHGHPARRVLRDLKEIGADIHRTDREYAGVFASDGTSIRELSWR